LFFAVILNAVKDPCICSIFNSEPDPLTSEQIRHPEPRLSTREGRGRRTCLQLILPLLLVSFCRIPQLSAQSAQPPTHAFHDPTYHLSFDYPAAWTFSQTDREISTFHLDARSAPRAARLRAVVAMPENPFPASTFSGAYLYFSVVPHTFAASCEQQARTTTIVKNTPHTKPGNKTQIAGIPFTHGHDEVKDICITQRDEIYTTRHAGACYRFDLAINNFCGGEVSGVKDITPLELDSVRTRLTSILSTIHFDPK
jgi:hypothetical protein